MEDQFGFIHEKFDIKMLILYVLRRLPAPIDAERLADLVLIDGGFSYFDYKDCLSELVDNAVVEENEDGYIITAKGSRNGEILESSLPFSVRMKADRSMAKVIEEMRRSAMILANHEVTDNGVIIYLAMNDGVGNIFDLKILASDENQAKKIEKHFKNNAEGYYHRFIEMLSE